MQAKSAAASALGGGGGGGWKPSFVPGATGQALAQQERERKASAGPYLIRPGSNAAAVWEEVRNDKAKGKHDAVFYSNRLTGETTWVRPAGMP